MAVTLTVGDVAVAIRAATDASNVPAPVAAVLGFLVPAGSAIVLDYAPDAPDAIHNAALIRLAGWLYDADPTDSRISNALEVSGASAMLSRWRVQRAGAITPVDGSFTPGGGGDVPAGAGLPDLPSAGTFILTVQNGALSWVEFPLPS